MIHKVELLGSHRRNDAIQCAHFRSLYVKEVNNDKLLVARGKITTQERLRESKVRDKHIPSDGGLDRTALSTFRRLSGSSRPA